jgi:hypothetical protein
LEFVEFVKNVSWRARVAYVDTQRFVTEDFNRELGRLSRFSPTVKTPIAWTICGRGHENGKSSLARRHGVTLARKIVQRSNEKGGRVQEILAKKFGVNRQRHTQDEIRNAVGVTQ